MKKDTFFNVKDKVCLITGALGLIGREFVHSCATAGAKIILVDVVAENEGQKFVKDLNRQTANPNLIYCQCDINDEHGVEKVLERTLTKFKRIDAVINSAYPKNKNYGKEFEKVASKDFGENINLHLIGSFILLKQAAEIMKRQKEGNIINIASIYGFSAPKFEIYKGTNMTTPIEYAAIKGAVINLTKYLASYLGRYNIRVNCISPGGIFNNQPQSFVKKYSDRVVLGQRMANPKDLSGVLLFLLSDASRYITGQNIVVDGGWSL